MVDNVKRSLNLLEEKNILHKSIILINSSFSQRRGYAAFQKYTSNDIKLIRINCDMINGYDLKNNWYKSDFFIRTILNEYIKSKILVSLNMI